MNKKNIKIYEPTVLIDPEKITYGDNIIIIDQENALIYPDDMSDSVHPNDVGYSKMAEAWFNAFSEI